ncbi:hypothetical protein PSECIP111951_00673 [Pseudoalteromonas holothuriae]|uniref:Prepilin-type N-terminal cleavage/methylation domain-containing protein n=1 Tax=Pseudoalteromonas holothuriae TaxID=2963714 RepID=A0ABN8UKL3_9GAMM|nr:prepilin-type N-terminal cleavage/methylation domain-containing protein [Pseudoalteromonas sp. CIP111951]CAH9052704.1 hypothetical protein PSECIP111951_00673 [Pseudoalteromonas sp. CIP111951]
MNQVRGFTLIEIMVVIVIITALAGLVGPMTINSINKNERRSELSHLTRVLKKAGYRAYLRQSMHTVFLGSQSLIITDSLQDAPWLTVTFKYLKFPKQTLFINENGFVSPVVVEVEYEQKRQTIELDKKVNGFVEVSL